MTKAADRRLIDKFNKIFKEVHFLKLSLHGYIVICGEGVKNSSVPAHNRFLYLVFSLNGDLLRQHSLEHHKRIKNLFLNSKEDMLIVASNHVREDKEYGNLEVLKLYGLESLPRLSNLVYDDTINKLDKKKNPEQRDRNR